MVNEKQTYFVESKMHKHRKVDSPGDLGLALVTCVPIQSSYLHDRIAVRSGTEIDLLSLRCSVSQGATFGDILLASVCSIKKIALWEGFSYLTSGSETNEGVAKTNSLSDLGIEPGRPGPKTNTLSTRLSLYTYLVDCS